MVKYAEQARDSFAVDRAFAALSHATRRAILDRLRHGSVTVSALAADFTISLPAVSKHLAVLEQANLVVRSKQGRERLCQLQPSSLLGAADWLEKYRPFWQAQLDSLDRYLAQTASEDTLPLDSISTIEQTAIEQTRNTR